MTVRPTALACAAALLAAPAARAAPAHVFELSYRGFGPVTSHGAFQAQDGYHLRFEGCYAKHSPEAVCGFTVRADRPLVLTNGTNLSHGSRGDGSPVRTCCLFAQGRPEGHPIVATGDAGEAAFSLPLEPGRETPVLLRVPDYALHGPPVSITFSRGEGDAGATFPTRVEALN